MYNCLSENPQIASCKLPTFQNFHSQGLALFQYFKVRNKPYFYVHSWPFAGWFPNPYFSSSEFSHAHTPRHTRLFFYSLGISFLSNAVQHQITISKQNEIKKRGTFQESLGCMLTEVPPDI